MATMDGPAQLLSLKVMRVSRPELASAWQPFYSSSPSFSAHSTASILSLQGTTPLPGHPKTLRDLTHGLELLTLPSSFGAIQLGETFSSCLSINNESQTGIEGVILKVEMQTQTAKILLAEMGGPEHRLAAGDTLECVVNHEIKELGQHVLACTVSYKSSSNARQLMASAEDSENPAHQTFRKFYKFAVTNPLSVKTKVHTPRSPSATTSLAERDRTFLEVHIQNLTQEPMNFERMQFECADGWDVEDANLIKVDADNTLQSLFSGTMTLMQPQDIRQYIYILTPKSTSNIPIVYQPGSNIALGRLNIFWRSSFGEPGRLLTSMLSRRIPLPLAPVQQAPSALPLYLKRTIAGPSPTRPQSPQLVQSRPATPPTHRPGSPLRNRSSSIGPVARPQSPFQIPLPPQPPEIQVSLVARHIPRNSIRVDTPFAISFTLMMSAPIPPGRENQRRAVKLVVQHLQPSRINASSAAPPGPPPEAFSPRLPSSGFSTPSTAAPPFNYGLAHQKILATVTEIDIKQNRTHPSGNAVLLPAPFFDGPDESRSAGLAGATFVGSSALFLPPVELISSPATDSPVHIAGADHVTKAHASQEFELSYLPIQQGFITIGGLRVLLIEDQFLNEDGLSEDDNPGLIQARVLKEWDVVAEVWVSS